VRVARAQLGDDLGAVVVAAGFAGREEDARVGRRGDGMSLNGSGFCASLRVTIIGERKYMPDIVTGVRQVVQDLVAPDLKAHTAKLEALQRQSEIQHDAVMKTLDAFRAEMRSEFAALRANNQVEVFRQISPISERVAVVKSRTKQGKSLSGIADGGGADVAVRWLRRQRAR
jgi:hypothetical protein